MPEPLYFQFALNHLKILVQTKDMHYDESTGTFSVAALLRYSAFRGIELGSCERWLLMVMLNWFHTQRYCRGAKSISESLTHHIQHKWDISKLKGKYTVSFLPAFQAYFK